MSSEQPSSDGQRGNSRSGLATLVAWGVARFRGLSEGGQIAVGVFASMFVVLVVLVLTVFRSQVWHATIFSLIALAGIAAVVGFIVGFLRIRRSRIEKNAAGRLFRRDSQLTRQHERSRLIRVVEDGDVAPLPDPGELLLRNSETLWYQCFASVSDGKGRSYGGNLYVTSMRLVFTCADYPVEIPIGNINAVRDHPEGIQVIGKTAGATESFDSVGDGELLRAHLSRAVRAYHRQIDVGFEKDASHYIPQDVKTAVFQRDGGKCVQCGATDYLEFDHIIPRAKGGANTVQNVQLLCRRCNLKESDAV